MLDLGVMMGVRVGCELQRKVGGQDICPCTHWTCLGGEVGWHAGVDCRGC